MFYTYILYSKRIGKYYVGQTKNLIRRLEDHNAGKTRYMKSGIPWELIYYLECTTRSEAVKIERKIKSRGANRFLTDIGVSRK